ncbi:hypothetical protein ACOZ4L_07565 [Haloplanus ruber]|uniref:Uncharacterized protein n=1 Tax=Haloplanus ruber TaxID=869892 RepID=A0ABD6CUU4_9EURY|nr:hypothetical protein [Haloplanus ruber]
MYQAEVHRTVSEVRLLERLSFDLTITDEAYQSEHSTDGEIRVFNRADDQVIRDREYPPAHPLGVLTGGVSGESESAYPGTTLYVGVAREPPLEQDEDAFQDDYVMKAIDVDGIPEDGVVGVDLDWDAAEARESMADDTARVATERYDISGLPNDQLPIIVRAELYRDAKRILRVLRNEEDGQRDDLRGRQQYEGQAALVLDIEHRTESGADSAPLRVEGLQVGLSRTFPQIQFDPEHGSSYDPQSRQVKWGSRTVQPGDTARYAIIGPISELLEVDRLDARLQATLGGRTLSGVTVAELFDESGESTQQWQESTPTVSEKTTITAEVEIDPSALRGESKEVSSSRITMQTTPVALFNELVKVCDRNGINITERSPPGDGTPVEGREGVYDVSGEDAGELDVRREYGDEGVVYAGMEITGRYTAMSEEAQVSTFDETEDRLVRRTKGGLDDAGRATLDIDARSADAELNSRFLSTIEEAFGGEM